MDRQEKLEREARDFVRLGATVGVVGLGSAALIGVTCPLCVVATPVLLGLGLVRHVQARRSAEASKNVGLSSQPLESAPAPGNKP